jgi:hypothetical protein
MAGVGTGEIEAKELDSPLVARGASMTIRGTIPVTGAGSCGRRSE